MIVCQDVIKFGITPRKTLSLEPIKVPDEYFRDFVRGYFDADGSVYIYTVNGTLQLKISICSASYKFIEFLLNGISKNLDSRQKSIYKEFPSKRKNPLYSFVFYINDGQKLGDLMYGHKPKLYLERKFKIFEQWKTIKRRKYVMKKSLAMTI